MSIASPSDVVEKHARRTAGAVEDYKKGISAVTESPTAKAAASEDKWLAGIQRAKEKGKFKSGLLRVSLDEWKSKALSKGANRIAAGVEAAKPKTLAFYEEFLPHVARLQDKLKGMPNNSIEDSIARSTESIRHNAEFKRGS